MRDAHHSIHTHVLLTKKTVPKCTSINMHALI
jgi:hypothetical protein